MSNQTNDERTILTCSRCSDMKTMVYGSIRGDCADCREPVWISQSGQGLIRQLGKQNVEIVCTGCLARRLKLEGKTEATLKMAPGAAEELERHFKRVGNN